MNDLDELIRQTVDNAIARDRAGGSEATPRVTRRRWITLPRIAAAVTVAAALVVAVAVSPWSSNAPSGGVGQRVLPSIETASARDVLRRTAAQVEDTGSGRWNYIRTSGWTLDPTQLMGVTCIKSGCTYYGPDRRPIDLEDVPYVRTGSLEWWSSGEDELARRQYATQHAGTQACLAPTNSTRCLGWEHRLLQQISPPHPFPTDARDGRAALERLARQRNDATFKAMSTGRFPTRGAALTPGEIGMRLLTGPVYDAADRARVMRALGELDGSINDGKVADASGRSGIQIRIAADRPAFRAATRRGKASTAAINVDRGPRFIVAVFDVEAGRLLQYRLDDYFGRMWDSRPREYQLVDEQERQETPTPTDTKVDSIVFPPPAQTYSVIAPDSRR